MTCKESRQNWLPAPLIFYSSGGSPTENRNDVQLSPGGACTSVSYCQTVPGTEMSLPSSLGGVSRSRARLL